MIWVACAVVAMSLIALTIHINNVMKLDRQKAEQAAKNPPVAMDALWKYALWKYDGWWIHGFYEESNVIQFVRPDEREIVSLHLEPLTFRYAQISMNTFDFYRSYQRYTTLKAAAFKSELEKK